MGEGQGFTPGLGRLPWRVLRVVIAALLGLLVAGSFLWSGRLILIPLGLLAAGVLFVGLAIVLYQMARASSRIAGVACVAGAALATVLGVGSFGPCYLALLGDRVVASSTLRCAEEGRGSIRCQDRLTGPDGRLVEDDFGTAHGPPVTVRVGDTPRGTVAVYRDPAGLLHPELAVRVENPWTFPALWLSLGLILLLPVAASLYGELRGGRAHHPHAAAREAILRMHERTGRRPAEQLTAHAKLTRPNLERR